MVHLIAMIASVLLLIGCGPKRNTEQKSTSYVRLPKAMLTESFIRSTGFNRDHKFDANFAFGYIAKDQMTELRKASQSAGEIIELDERYKVASFNASTLIIDDEEDAGPAERRLGYPTHEALGMQLYKIASASPLIAKVESIGKSVENRDLWMMKLSDNVDVDEAEPKLLYVANIHGDEVVGRELMMMLIKHLSSSYGKDPELTALLNHAQIYIVPSLNPDGFAAGQRENANMVDVNRNFPDFSSVEQDSTYGKEPETIAMMALHSKHHFLLALNFHGGEICFNLPWDTIPNLGNNERFGDDPLIYSLGRQYADLNPSMSKNNDEPFVGGLTYGYEWYEVDGGLQDWSNYYRQAIHATVELSASKWPRYRAIKSYWRENQQSLLQFLQNGLVGIHLNVTDDKSLPVSNVSVAIKDQHERILTYKSAYIHRNTLIGTHEVEFSAPGYVSKTINVPASKFADEFLNVSLQKMP